MAVSASPYGVLRRSRTEEYATLPASLTNGFVVGARSTHDDLRN
jgi:hypothetical protein